jgi:hypothetical protein
VEGRSPTTAIGQAYSTFLFYTQEGITEYREDAAAGENR